KESVGTLVTNNDYGSIKPDGLLSWSCPTSVSSTDTSKNAIKASASSIEASNEEANIFTWASKEANHAYDIPENMVELIKKSTVPDNVSSSLCERKESAGTLVTNNDYGPIKPDGLASLSCPTSVCIFY
ncbi:hypothetical protein FRX31_010304, partial [Thalictrum thalictroides]